MHFCVSAARVSLPGMAPAHLLTSAFFWPRKMGTNWFMPALVKSRFGESGMRLDEGTMVCCFDLKKSRNDWRISLLVIKSVRTAPYRAAGLLTSITQDANGWNRWFPAKATGGENRQISSGNASASFVDCES